MSLLGRSFCLSKPVQPRTRLRSGEKGEKNRRAKRAERQSDGGGNVAPPFPPPQATAWLISFADIFPIWPRFLPFSPTAEPGLGLMTVTLWYLRNYLWMTKSQLHASNTSSSITNNRNKHWKTIRSKNLFQSSSSLSFPAFFRIFSTIHTFF